MRTVVVENVDDVPPKKTFVVCGKRVKTRRHSALISSQHAPTYTWTQRTLNLRISSLLPVTNIDDGEQRRRLVEAQDEPLKLLRGTHEVVRKGVQQAIFVAIDSEPDLTATGEGCFGRVDRGEVGGEAFSEKCCSLPAAELALLYEVGREDVAVAIDETEDQGIVFLEREGRQRSGRKGRESVCRSTGMKMKGSAHLEGADAPLELKDVLAQDLPVTICSLERLFPN